MPESWQQWFPQYIEPWLSSDNIQDLSDAGYRAVHNLLLRQWQQKDGTLPADERELARMSRKRDAWSKIRSEVLEHFPGAGAGRVANPRLLREWRRALEIHEGRVRGGKVRHHLPAGTDSSSTGAQLDLTTTQIQLQKQVQIQEKKKPAPGKLDSSPTFVALPLVGDELYAVTEAAVKELGELFPTVDVHQELRNIRAWNLANPRKRKTRAGIRDHIRRWMQSEQQKSAAAQAAGQRPWFQQGLPAHQPVREPAQEWTPEIRDATMGFLSRQLAAGKPYAPDMISSIRQWEREKARDEKRGPPLENYT